MKDQLLRFLSAMMESVRDLAPIVLVIAFFQIAVLQQPIPNLAGLLGGTLLVVLGLTMGIPGRLRPGPAVHGGCLGGDCHSHRRAAYRGRLADTISHHRRIPGGGGDDCLCSGRDHRCCLRLRRCDHVHHYGAAGDRPRGGAGQHDSGAQPHSGWLRADRLCQRFSHHDRDGLRAADRTAIAPAELVTRPRSWSSGRSS